MTGIRIDDLDHLANSAHRFVYIGSHAIRPPPAIGEEYIIAASQWVSTQFFEMALDPFALRFVSMPQLDLNAFTTDENFEPPSSSTITWYYVCLNSEVGGIEHFGGIKCQLREVTLDL